MKYYSEKLNRVYDTPEACQKAEFEAKEQENRDKILAERKAAELKEKKEKEAAERKEAAAAVEAARTEMIKAQKNYSKVLGDFIAKYKTYHYTTTSLDEVPTLFNFISDWI